MVSEKDDSVSDLVFLFEYRFKGMEKIDDTKAEDGKIIVEFNLPEEKAYITSSLVWYKCQISGTFK